MKRVQLLLSLTFSLAIANGFSPRNEGALKNGSIQQELAAGLGALFEGFAELGAFLSNVTDTLDDSSEEEIERPSEEKTTPLHITQQTENSSTNGCPSNIGKHTTCKRFPSVGCYCFVSIKRSWSEANRFCRSVDMTLVSIETKEESVMLNSVIKSEYPTARFWTSGSDEGNEGTWKWTASGQPLSFTDWDNWGSSQQPDNRAAKQHYLSINFKSRGLWADENGAELYPSICEKTSYQSSVTKVTPVNSEACPSDIGPSTTCGKVLPLVGCYCFVYQQISWEEAADFCHSHQMQLASIESQRESSGLWSVLKDSTEVGPFWLSASDDGHDGDFIWRSTGQPLDYNDWCRGEPNNKGSNEHYAIASGWNSTSFCWNDVPQSYRANAICEMRPSYQHIPASEMTVISQKSTSSKNTPVCPDSIETNSTSSCHATADPPGCYCVIQQDTSWMEADSMCRELNMHLVSIGTMEENEAIEKIFEEYTEFGGSSSKGLLLWTSGIKTRGTWKWSDNNKAVTFTDWRSGQPDNYKNEEEFINLLYDDKGFGWNDMVGVQNSYFDIYPLCEVDISPPSFGDVSTHEKDANGETTTALSVINQTETTTSCPKSLASLSTSSCHATEDPAGCYCLIQRDTSWLTADKMCREFNMNLVSIETAEEDAAIGKLFADYTQFDVSRSHGLLMWTSAVIKTDDNTTWQWSATGESLNFTNWKRGEAIINDDREEDRISLVVNSDGFGWDDLNHGIHYTHSVYPLCENKAPVINVVEEKLTSPLKNNPLACPDRIDSDSPEYCFIEKDTSWADADNMCRQLNMRLVSIETEEENDAIAQLFNETSSPVRMWTSAVFDKSIPSGNVRWKWSATAKLLNFTDWGNRVADEDGNLNRIYLNVDRYNIGWFFTDEDENIFFEIYPLCEVADDNQTESFTTSDLDLRPSNQTKDFKETTPVCSISEDVDYNSTCHITADPAGCYCLIQNQTNWSQADDMCRKSGMHLVSIETAEENEAIRKLFSRIWRSGDVKSESLRMWTSGTSEKSENIFDGLLELLFGEHNETDTWKWSATGESLNFTDWRDGDRSNSTINEGRIELVIDSNGFGWNENKITSELFPLCEDRQSSKLTMEAGKGVRNATNSDEDF